MWGILLAILFIYSFFRLLLTELWNNGSAIDWLIFIIALIIAFAIAWNEE